MPLIALKVTNARPGRHADMHGLYLLVRDSGARSRVLRMQHAGMRRDFGLGPIHDISLADARARSAAIRRQVRAGQDPEAGRPKRRNVSPTFEKVTRDCSDAMNGGWKDQRCISWLTSFERHVFLRIGAREVTTIDGVAVLSLLEPIGLAIPDTSKRVLQRIGTVLDYAHIKGLIAEEVSLRSVTRGLPRQTRQVTHRAAMAHAKVPAFTWEEFDLDASVWAIPAARMKQQIGIGGEPAPATLLFTFSGAKPISDMTMLKVLGDMKIQSATVHDFRSSFTDWVAECTDVPKEVADKAWAHQIPNAVEAAYRRTDFFDKRRALMEGWAAHLDG